MKGTLRYYLTVDINNPILSKWSRDYSNVSFFRNSKTASDYAEYYHGIATNESIKFKEVVALVDERR